MACLMSLRLPQGLTGDVHSRGLHPSSWLPLLVVQDVLMLQKHMSGTIHQEVSERPAPIQLAGTGADGDRLVGG